MHGFLLIDKPGGITSHDVVRRIRRKLSIRRVGHGGTLDPMATVLIPVAVGDATRLLEFFSDGDKGYSATMRLGETTDSQDADGEIIATADWQQLQSAQIEAAVNGMAGPIEQIPPMFSALKKNGVPLYKLARQGKEIEREPRKIHIYSYEITDFENPFVKFRVKSTKGTYVRTLAHDLGNDLGVGASLIADGEAPERGAVAEVELLVAAVIMHGAGGALFAVERRSVGAWRHQRAVEGGGAGEVRGAGEARGAGEGALPVECERAA